MYTEQFEANVPFQTNRDKIAVIFDTPGSVTMEYSVDGTTWTQWSEPLADSNVIIASIPIGLYIKFSSAGKYTGE